MPPPRALVGEGVGSMTVVPGVGTCKFFCFPTHFLVSYFLVFQLTRMFALCSVASNSMISRWANAMHGVHSVIGGLLLTSFAF